jgi:glutaredoxin
MGKIQIFGTSWSTGTDRILAFLSQKNIAFEYINIEKMDAGDEETIQYGRHYLPTVVFNGKSLNNPENTEIAALFI